MPPWFRDARRQPSQRPMPPPAGAGFRDDAAWWHVMGYHEGPPRSLDQVERQFRRLAAAAHPDRGGSAERMQQLIRARAQARRQLTR